VRVEKNQIKVVGCKTGAGSMSYKPKCGSGISGALEDSVGLERCDLQQNFCDARRLTEFPITDVCCFKPK